MQPTHTPKLIQFQLQLHSQLPQPLPLVAARSRLAATLLCQLLALPCVLPQARVAFNELLHMQFINVLKIPQQQQNAHCAVVVLVVAVACQPKVCLTLNLFVAIQNSRKPRPVAALAISSLIKAE